MKLMPLGKYFSLSIYYNLFLSYFLSSVYFILYVRVSNDLLNRVFGFSFAYLYIIPFVMYKGFLCCQTSKTIGTSELYLIFQIVLYGEGGNIYRDNIIALFLFKAVIQLATASRLVYSI